MKLRTKTLIGIFFAAITAIAVFWYLRDSHRQPPEFRTGTISHGDLLVSIDATGTVEPEEVIDIGAQIAGKVVSFGMDQDGRMIDYGSNVEQGTVLARIDDALYQADAAQARAQVRQAEASLLRAKADLEQLKARADQAERDWIRARKLTGSPALSQTDFDAFRAAHEIALANVSVGNAAVQQAEAAKIQAEAAARRAEQNLSYCIIRSPVKGVIIDRRVNIGQTVVASLNAPSLFLLAKDLKRMQVWVAVNEADIGKIYPGQPVTFTVDAYPGEVFTGEVGKIRLNAAMTQNVVSYTVEVLTDNSDGKLLPYLTANVRFERKKILQVFLAPNAALRWKPNAEQAHPDYRSREEIPTPRIPGSAEPKISPTTQTSSKEEIDRKAGTLWIRQGDYVRPLPVAIGSTDGIVSEVHGEGLFVNQEVIIGQSSPSPASSPSSNPFIPQFRRRGGR
jgi:HlyD family secretion protein